MPFGIVFFLDQGRILLTGAVRHAQTEAAEEIPKALANDRANLLRRGCQDLLALLSPGTHFVRLAGGISSLVGLKLFGCHCRLSPWNLIRARSANLKSESPSRLSLLPQP
jgi:hypothetical protein